MGLNTSAELRRDDPSNPPAIKTPEMKHQFTSLTVRTDNHCSPRRQFSVLQLWTPSSEPGHSAPPLRGRGSSHFLVLLCDSLPHSLPLQELHSVHGPQLPSTGAQRWRMLGQIAVVVEVFWLELQTWKKPSLHGAVLSEVSGNHCWRKFYVLSSCLPFML